ncbi:MAG TPA: hypothetical protein VGG77_16945 [Roseiarcus sp.]|jgi:hypothetical protein
MILKRRNAKFKGEMGGIRLGASATGAAIGGSMKGDGAVPMAQRAARAKAIARDARKKARDLAG